MTFRLPLKNFRLLKLSFTIKILKKNKKWPKYSTSWLRDDLVRHSTPALFIEVYKRRDLWRAGNIWESLWCCSLPPLQGFKKGSRRAVCLWIASYNLSCVFLTSMYSEELTIGSQEWINKSDWSVFLCWLVLAVRVKNRSWSVLRPLTDTCASKHSLIFCLWWIVNDSHGMRWRNCTANWMHLELYDNSLRTRLTFGWSRNIDAFFATF